MAIETLYVDTAIPVTTTTFVNTEGAGITTAVTFMSLCNHDTVTRTVDIHVVPSGGTAQPDNILISALEIVADDTYIVYQGNEKLFLDNGDSIRVVASVGAGGGTINKITAITSYVVV